MYLYINPSGNRHILCRTFKQILAITKRAKDNFEYRYTILDVDSPGSYDMIISRITETVSKKQYIKARFVFNPTNIYKSAIEKEVVGMFGALLTHPPPSTEKSFDALTLLPESLLVNGFLPLETDIGDSVLDDFKTLTTTLDDFFKPPPKVNPVN